MEIAYLELPLIAPDFEPPDSAQRGPKNEKSEREQRRQVIIFDPAPDEDGDGNDRGAIVIRMS